MPRASCPVQRNDDGFTLIEILMIVVVVSIALPTLFLMLGQSVSQRVRAELETDATQVAQAMMEEIKSKKWDENSPIPAGMYTAIPAPEAGETHPLCNGLPVPVNFYDDVDDYNGYSEQCTWDMTRYTTSATVCYVDPADLNTCLALAVFSDYKKIVVTVSNVTLGAVELVTVVTNY